jgi:hypothetical protein
MLSNFETEKSKLLQIVLVGQPNLCEPLGAPELQQLRQRITVSYHLQPLDAAETANYINHRLRRAALGAPLAFPRETTDAVHAHSRGMPRVVNVICDAALVFGCAEERRTIDLALVEEVLSELEFTDVLPPVDSTDMTEPAPAPAPAPARVPAAAAVVAGGSQGLHEAPVASPLQQDLTLRAAELDRREQAVRQRERALAEQRRILAEEYRLLRCRPAAPPQAHTPPSAQVEAQAHVPEASDCSGSRWRRLKRAMLGTSSPAME